jgi:hypothetical protein
MGCGASHPSAAGRGTTVVPIGLFTRQSVPATLFTPDSQRVSGATLRSKHPSEHDVASEPGALSRQASFIARRAAELSASAAQRAVSAAATRAAVVALRRQLSSPGADSANPAAERDGALAERDDIFADSEVFEQVSEDASDELLHLAGDSILNSAPMYDPNHRGGRGGHDDELGDDSADDLESLDGGGGRGSRRHGSVVFASSLVRGSHAHARSLGEASRPRRKTAEFEPLVAMIEQAGTALARSPREQVCAPGAVLVGCARVRVEIVGVCACVHACACVPVCVGRVLRVRTHACAARLEIHWLDVCDARARGCACARASGASTAVGSRALKT